MIGWAAAVTVSVGMRSLYISVKSADESGDVVNVWGEQYITGVSISGMCWGSLGIIASIYGDLAALRNQTLFSPSRPISDAGTIFIGEAFLLIGEEGEGIHVFDNSVPENPVNLGFINIFGSREFYLSGKTL